MFSPLAEQVREVDVRARQSGLQCDCSPVFNFRLTIQMGITEHDADVVVRDDCRGKLHTTNASTTSKTVLARSAPECVFQ